MKFLEVKTGIAIKLDSIDKVEKVDELNCRLFCGFDIYDVTLPYDIVMNLLNNDEKPKDNSQILQEISKKIGILPVFAG